MSYGYGYNSYESDPELLLEFYAQVLPVVLVIAGVIALAVYICQSIALMNIARRRGLNSPWIAWIPFCGGYALGRISDDINLKKGKKSSHRKVLLGMELATVILSAIVLLSVISVMQDLFTQALAGTLDYMTEEEVLRLMTPMLASLVLLLPLMVVAVIYAIFLYIALYNTFKAYSPNYAVLFLVLSIFISYCQPIFLLVIQNKEPVMPVPPAGYGPNGGYNPYQTYYANGQPYQTYQSPQNTPPYQTYTGGQQNQPYQSFPQGTPPQGGTQLQQGTPPYQTDTGIQQNQSAQPPQGTPPHESDQTPPQQ